MDKRKKPKSCKYFTVSCQLFAFLHSKMSSQEKSSDSSTLNTSSKGGYLYGNLFFEEKEMLHESRSLKI